MSNTTITRETLELAALAAGYAVDIYRSHYEWLAIVGGQVVWCPQINMLDAARLAVKIDAQVRLLDRRVEALAISERNLYVKSVTHDGTQASKEFAWCSAITLVAADIGRKMEVGAA